MANKLRRRTASANDKLQLALGVWWIVDAALQFQSAMFTSRFAHEVIQPAASGQPGFVAAPIHLASHIILWAPGPMNGLFGLIQLVIGIGLLFRRTVRPALVLSVAWSLNVWYLGEGLGGLAGGKAMLLTGAPGAVLLYALLAVAVWPKRERPAGWLVGAWVLLWLGGCALQVIAGGGAVRDAVSSNADAAPTWMRSADHALLSALPRSGAAIVLLLVALQAWVGLSVLGGRRFRVIPLAVGSLLALAFWLFGESLGTYWTGVATDPNSGPLLVLLALAVLAAPATVPSWRPALLAGRRASALHVLRPAAAALPTGLLMAATVVILAATGSGTHSPRARPAPAPVQAEQVAAVPQAQHPGRRVHRGRSQGGRLAAVTGGRRGRAPAAAPRRGRAPGTRSAPSRHGRVPERLIRERRPGRGLSRPRPSEALSGPPTRAPVQGQGPVHQLAQSAQASVSQAPAPAGPAAGQAVGAAASALPPG